ncbi:Transcriptional regulator, LysR family [hydrothermal vent metagenome]|uniref:Transcriptional regulator, LysR family n=1 Tax=hydrothermal vent metagenome TaxID=652676 RepID=A0A3B0XJP1_9ZZZZ
MDSASRLILFADVIDSGSFSKAAKRRSVNRSLVSKQIARLESELGIRLLNRTTRSISLTDAGHSIYQHACSLRHQLLETDALVESIREGVSGELRISSTSHFGREHVMPVIRSLLDNYPGLTIDLRLEDRYVDIVAERFDVAVRVTQPADSSLIARKLTENPLIMVASPDYIARNGQPETIKDLCDHHFIVYAGDDRVMSSWTYREKNEIKTFNMNVRIKVNDGYALLKTAEDGMGISLTAAFVCSRAINEGRLVRVLPNIKLDAFAPIYVMYTSRSYVPKKTRLFIDYMVKYVSEQDFYIS